MPMRNPAPVPSTPAPQILSQQFPNYAQVTTQAPGAGFQGMGSPFGGFDFGSMSRYANQMAAYKAAQQARQEAYARQQAEREFQFRQQQAQQAAAQEADKIRFAREQWQALQDEKNQYVPLYTTEVGRGIQATPGMTAPSTRAMPGAIAAGYVPASMAAQYGGPSSASFEADPGTFGQRAAESEADRIAKQRGLETQLQIEALRSARRQ